MTSSLIRAEARKNAENEAARYSRMAKDAAKAGKEAQAAKYRLKARRLLAFAA